MGKILRNSANVHDQDTGDLVGYVNPITGREVAAPALTAEAVAAVEALVSGTGISGTDLVVAVGGQSNVLSGAWDSATSVPHPSCLLYTRGRKIEVCSEPSGKYDDGWTNNIPPGGVQGTPRHGFATAMLRGMLDLTGVRGIAVVRAVGSTNLANWLPPATENDRTTLFGQLTADVNDLAPSTRTVPLWVWSGHEAGSAAVSESLSAGTIVNTSGYAADWRNHWAQVRARYPGCPIIFVQLGTDATALGAVEKRRAAELQRQSESTYGATTAIAAYSHIAAPVWQQVNANTNASNIITWLGNGIVRITSDGTAGVQATFVGGLTPGAKYRVQYTVTGTGPIKLTTTAQDSPAINAGSGEFTITIGAEGIISWRRNTINAVIDCTMTVTSIALALPLTIDGTAAMVVQHDLPRNPSPDDEHLSAAGHRILGERIARAYAERVLGYPINGTGPRLVSCTKSGADVVVKFNRVIQPDANGYGASLATSLFRVYLNGVEQTLTACARDGSDTTAVRITCAASVASGTCVVTYGDRAGPGTTIMRPGCVYDTDGLPAPMTGPIVAV